MVQTMQKIALTIGLSQIALTFILYYSLRAQGI